MPLTSYYDNPVAYDNQLTYDNTAPQPIVVVPVVIPHLSNVLSLSPDGSFAFIQQDTTDDITQCVELISSTPMGQRTMVPSLGVPDPTFQYPVDKNQILQNIATFEPRASASVTISYIEGQTNVQIAVAPVQGTSV